MKKFFSFIHVVNGRLSIVEKWKRILVVSGSENLDEYIKGVSSSCENTAKMVDLFACLAYLFSGAFYFVAHGYIRVKTFGFIEIINENMVYATFLNAALILSTISILHFIRGANQFCLLEAIYDKKCSEQCTDKLFVYTFNFHFMTMLWEFSRLNKKIFWWKAVYSLVSVCFLIFLAGPGVLSLSQLSRYTSKIDVNILEYYLCVYYVFWGIMVFLVLAGVFVIADVLCSER
ncbi:hypothetical protein K9F62_11280 [Desulfovibrio sp. JY]|nr:hypothetical protein K9F62_11280 [Desulfovibrio sp. JY]